MRIENPNSNKYSAAWREKFYMSEEWKQKQETVLRKADYQCQECKRYGRRRTATEVHHIQHLDARPDLALTDSNLIALCHSCHNRQHPEKVRAARERRNHVRY
jgi:5-methylcytosine-specific restriction endonuclease McrA